MNSYRVGTLEPGSAIVDVLTESTARRCERIARSKARHASRTRFFTAVLCLAILAACISVSVPEILKLYEINRGYENVQTTLHHYDMEIDRLQEEIAYAGSDEYIKIAARTELGLVRGSATLYVACLDNGGEHSASELIDR